MKHLDQMNVGSELFLKEKMKQDIAKDLKMIYGDNIVSECCINLSYVHNSYILKKKSGLQAIVFTVVSALKLQICC